MKQMKAIIFDIDDTLYSHKLKRVPSLTYYTLKKLKENGYKIGFCTSRYPKEFYSLPKDIFEYADLVISGTGGIYQQNDEIIRIISFDKETSNKYIHYLNKQENMYYMWVTPTQEAHFSKPPIERIFKHHEDWSGKCPTVQDYNDEELINIVYYNATDEQIQDILRINDDTNVERWGDCGHINPRGINKAFGIEQFSKYFNIDLEDIICFGDGANDVSMIKKAGIGVAVGNGHEILKKQATYVCDNIENNGIYTFCVEHKLINPIDSKIFFFDIDGTTYRHDIQACPDSTKLAIKTLKENGHKTCICTSRNIEEMVNLPKEFLDMFDATIRLAGGHLTIEGKEIYNEVDHEELCNVVEYFNEHNIPYRYVVNDGHGYLVNSTEYVRGLFKYQYQMCPPEKKYENEPVIHYQYYLTTPEQDKEIKNIVKKSTITHLRVSHEITQENLDKSTAIHQVAKYYGYNPENTVAFGDGGNDVTMLQSAQIGIAMGNACDACKQIADYVTDSIEENGLYKACKHFKWI